MNLKLKKIVKNNVVDYGTPDIPNLGFEEKFKMLSIIKFYKRIFFKKKFLKKERQLDTINTYSTQRNFMPKGHFQEILLKNHNVNRLIQIGKDFKNKCIKNKYKILYDVNNANHLLRLEKSRILHLRLKYPFNESKYKLQTLKTNKINDNLSARYSLNLFKKSISNLCPDELKYKKINNFKDFASKLKFKELLRKKNLLKKNITINGQINNSSNITGVILNKNKKENETKKESDLATGTVSDDYFEIDEFDKDKTIKQLKKRYNFFHKKSLDIEDINTAYFILLRKMLKNNPGVKFHFDLKESEKIVRKMKNSYNFKKTNISLK